LRFSRAITIVEPEATQYAGFMPQKPPPRCSREPRRPHAARRYELEAVPACGGGYMPLNEERFKANRPSPEREDGKGAAKPWRARRGKCTTTTEKALRWHECTAYASPPRPPGENELRRHPARRNRGVRTEAAPPRAGAAACCSFHRVKRQNQQPP